ncbi:hypothetical protein KFK09_013119 [Dendrobium nobile]|uniref:Uncharacterized protein n=1 Tax=Dendrobium nobile TaxID=94219 RepID=A0A8T3B7W7_DENNO|nr:hypothetical protein KFK09_013119 [Dendrobium nobile]
MLGRHLSRLDRSKPDQSTPTRGGNPRIGRNSGRNRAHPTGAKEEFWEGNFECEGLFRHFVKLLYEYIVLFSMEICSCYVTADDV